MNNDARSDWAEELERFGPDAKLTSGAPAAAQGRATLEAAMGGPKEVENALRGRQPLDGRKAPGYRSPTHSVRLTEDLDAKLTRAAKVLKRQKSDVVREALTEYFERHSA